MENRVCWNCVYALCDEYEESCRNCHNTVDKPNFVDVNACKKAFESAVKLSEEVDKVDMVNNPPHYTQGGMETIDEMVLIFGKEAVANFCICNAWKYRARALYKNKDEDMKKSHWYINKYKELMGE